MLPEAQSHPAQHNEFTNAISPGDLRRTSNSLGLATTILRHRAIAIATFSRFLLNRNPRPAISGSGTSPPCRRAVRLLLIASPKLRSIQFGATSARLRIQLARLMRVIQHSSPHLAGKRRFKVVCEGQ